MTIVVDASALVAMAVKEPEAQALGDRLNDDPDRVYCAIGAWEASVAISRIRSVSVADAERALDRLISDFAIRLVPIGIDEGRAALVAQARYGKLSGHAAKLNLGDCFAYACAKTHNATLLYKGNDFAQTDLA